MAEDKETGGEKTESPSSRKLQKAREDGMVSKSQDFSQIMGMMGAFIAIQFMAPVFWKDMIIILQSGFTTKYATQPMTLGALRHDFYGVLLLVLPPILIMMLVSAICGGGVTALQTNFLFSLALLRPKFNLLNPIGGLKKIASIQNSIQFLKALAKLAIIGPIAYYAFLDYLPQLIGLMEVPQPHLLPFAGKVAQYIFWKVATLLFLLAVADLIWQKWRHHQQMKMTKSESKDERKAIEGDEATKTQIRSKGMARLRKRMMLDVPKADVIVTNPTHIAVALSYSMEPGAAPKVIAKGAGFVAERIREIGRAAGVPVIERKPLARALFKACEVGQSIPYELYAAVAEVLAYVYRIKGVNPFRNRQAKPQADPGR